MSFHLKGKEPNKKFMEVILEISILYRKQKRIQLFLRVHELVLQDVSQYCWATKNVKCNKTLYGNSGDIWKLFYILFFKIYLFFNWRRIALQNFAVFCQTSTWISLRYTYIPSLLNLPPISLPIPSL